VALATQEYQFRKLIPMTHEQYLDEPVWNVRFFLKLKGLENEIKAERK